MNEIWDAIVLGLTVGLTWFAGETGRAIIIGGMGGMTRWLVEGRRTIGAAVLAWAGGAVCGVYLTPIVMWMVGYAPDANVTEAERLKSAFVFVTGSVGISLLKIIIAGVEMRAKKWGRDDG
jgi:hypothetical protein